LFSANLGDGSRDWFRALKKFGIAPDELLASRVQLDRGYFTLKNKKEDHLLSA